jgi:hypothetical protein
MAMISRITHRFIIRKDASGLDAFWLKAGLVRATDIDCTDMSIERFGELYQSMRDDEKERLAHAVLR